VSEKGTKTLDYCTIDPFPWPVSILSQDPFSELHFQTYCHNLTAPPGFFLGGDILGKPTQQDPLFTRVLKKTK